MSSSDSQPTTCCYRRKASWRAGAWPRPRSGSNNVAKDSRNLPESTRNGYHHLQKTTTKRTNRLAEPVRQASEGPVLLVIPCAADLPVTAAVPGWARQRLDPVSVVRALETDSMSPSVQIRA